MSDTKLVAYVGRGLGSNPTTVLPGGPSISWDRASGQVRAMPAVAADRLMLDAPGQFAFVDTMPDAAKRYSLKADRLAKLAEHGKLHVATYRKRGEEPSVVVILDAQTKAGIDAEHERAAKAKDRE